MKDMIINMKKTIALLWVTLVLLTSCNFDDYPGERPPDYGNFTWVCTEYNMWFRVDWEKYDGYTPEGEIEIDGEIYLGVFAFMFPGDEISISVYPLEYASIPNERRNRFDRIAELCGYCTSYDDSFTIQVNPEQDTLFNGKVEMITFYRQNE